MDTVSSGLNSNLRWERDPDGTITDEERANSTVDNGKLTQEDFFSLLTEQLANQDPTKPVDNDQMVAQMTSFTMAEGIENLNTKFADFATSMTSNQALQASSLIGQQVLLQGDVGYVGAAGQNISGVVINEQTTQNLEITIETEAGEIVRTFSAGTQAAGNIEFNWDGTDGKGNQMPSGNYVVKAQGQVADETQQIPTAINRHVDSVSLAASSQGIILNLDGDVSVKLDDVIQIGG
ncbi:flagellar hook assembly protein FlgD [Paraglaciecola aquimarina]|uniref:Basal-body rod modification protein FlgD n=1 Tax=Paraglaciecola aquimarina TaxID=1235557 RepID=A0ABU3T0G2_9ALTE|nr:flagellar hook assembly protein FlgD [Paraglaciecola aquimarina]MDU0355738.1 flagellar hook assembly protein FlgD [Paraglaciecola aquimarina]